MKTTLLVVGRTVEQHFITAINDYVQRTKRYLSFEMEVIPETWFFRETLGSSSCDDYIKNQINYKIISIEKVFSKID